MKKNIIKVMAGLLVAVAVGLAGCGGGGGNTTVTTGGGNGGSTATSAKTIAGNWALQGTVTTSTCSSQPVGYQFTGIFAISQNTASSNTFTLTPPQGLYFGHRGVTTGNFMTLLVQNSSVSSTFVEPALSTSECPTCAWTQSLALTLASNGDSMSGTLTKTGTGGECSNVTTATFTRQ